MRRSRSLFFAAASTPTPNLNPNLNPNPNPKLLSHSVHKPATWDGRSSIVFCHGILGRKTNFRTACIRWTKSHEQFQAITIDHRGHGDNASSPGLNSNTIQACAQDIMALLHNNTDPQFEGVTAPPTILCGHSFGGEVCLAYLQLLVCAGLPLPRHTWILDSLPGLYNPPEPPDKDSAYDIKSPFGKENNQSVSELMAILSNLPPTFPSKSDVMKELALQKVPLPIAHWLATNIVPVGAGGAGGGAGGGGAGGAGGAGAGGGGGGEVRFSFDMKVINALFEDFCRTDMTSFLSEYRGAGAIHFIRAGKNPLWTDEVLAFFEELMRTNPRIKLHTMPHVGHWLHAEDLEGTLGVISANSRGL